MRIKLALGMHRGSTQNGVSIVPFRGAAVSAVAIVVCMEIGALGQTTNRFTDLQYDSVPGIDPVFQSLDLATRSDFTNRPVYIHVHGGGWKNGDKSNVAFKETYALDHGYVFVSMNYRLTTTNSGTNVFFPQHVQDVASGIAWIHRNVTGYGGDSNRIYISGHSAGAHLVALIASDPRWLGTHGLSPAVLRAVVANDSAAYDLPYMSLPGGTLGTTYTDIFGFDPLVWQFVSPATYAKGDACIPPMALCYSAGTTPSVGRQAERRAQAMGFQAQLAGGGVPSVVIDGSTNAAGLLRSHSEINAEFGMTNDPVTKAAFDFIEHSSDFVRLKFRQDYPVGTRDAGSNHLGGTEMESLVAHAGMLFAANGYWQDIAGADPVMGAQILVKESATGTWRQDMHFGAEYLTVESLASLTFYTDATGVALPEPVSLLLAGPHHVVPPYRLEVWSRDDTTGVWTEMPLAVNYTNANGIPASQVRSLGAHVDRVTGVSRVFAGTGRGAVYSGVFDSGAPGRIRWDAVPELPEVPPAARERAYAFAEANGVLYVSVASNDDPSDNVGGLFRRNDGPDPTWTFVYEWPTVPGKGDGLRGLTAVPAAPGSTNQVLLGGLEGPGHIIRIDPDDDHSVSVEFDYKSFFTNLWGSLGGAATLSAYNDMTAVADPRDGKPLHLIGLWVNHPADTTPPHNGSYYLVRHPDARYEWGRLFDYSHPVPDGKELKGMRCIVASPFAEEQGRVFYFGGYDAGGAALKHNTAWIYRGELPAIELPLPAGDAPPLDLARIGSNTWLLTIGTTSTNDYHLEESADLVTWTNEAHRITGTGRPYPTVWISDPGVSASFIRFRATHR